MKSKVFKTVNKIKNILLTVLLVALVLVVTFAMLIKISGNTPSIGGYMLFRVASGSMEPDLALGDVILVKETDDYSAIQVGDVVSFQSVSGETAGRIITHAVIVKPYEKNGEWLLQTQGIANDIPDEVIRAEQLKGVMVTKIPLLRELYSFFLTPWGLITIIALIVIAFAGEFINVVKILSAENGGSKSAVDVAVERVMAQQDGESSNGQESSEKNDMN